MVDYSELADIADRLFEASDDDDEQLADVLDTLDEETRDALLTSDFLNAYQVFYYYFRERSGDMARERLQLSAASDLARGITIDEIDIYEVVFYQKEATPASCSPTERMCRPGSAGGGIPGDGRVPG